MKYVVQLMLYSLVLNNFFLKTKMVLCILKESETFYLRVSLEMHVQTLFNELISQRFYLLNSKRIY